MSIWKNPLSLEALNASRRDTLIGHLGIAFSELGDDFVSATMPVDPRTRQPYGLLHGGASVVLAETLGSVGATMCVEKSLHLTVGQEINANHVRSVRSGWVTGTARPAHLGARTHVWTIDIVNESKELVCIARLTVAVLDVRPATPAARTETP